MNKKDLHSKIESLRALDKLATPAPWEHSCDEEEPSYDICTPDGSQIAFCQPFGNINTIISEGREFHYPDAQLIVELRNTISDLIEYIDCLENKIHEK